MTKDNNKQSDSLNNAVLQQQLAHSSVRAYEDKPISDEMLIRIIEAGQAAASSSFIQACTIIRVTRPEAREPIAEAAGGQKWIIAAPEFLVFCADLKRINHACVAAGMGEMEGYSEHSLAAIVDAGLVAQNVILAAESLGLGGVYIGGLRNNPQITVDQLALPENVIPVFGMCLGWPAAKPEVKPRMPVELILHTDQYQETTEAQYAAYDQTMADYYANRSSNIKLTDWTKATATAVQGKKREHMLEFMQQRGFFKQ